MAASNNSAAAYILKIAIVVVFAAAAAAPPAQAQLLNGLTVSSRVCCTATGNCPGKALVSTIVKLNCTNATLATATVGQKKTTSSGFFNITVRKTPGIILLGFPILPCVAVIPLPVSAAICPALSNTTGSLVSAVRGSGTVAGRFGRLQNGTTIGFAVSPRI